MTRKKLKINYQLFRETTHSPALADIVDKENLGEVIDFCFIANPYYPTKPMMKELLGKIPSIIKAYPSSNPVLAQKELASVLHVNPDYLVLGNGATELITLIEKELVDQIAIPVPTFSEYLDKLRDPKAAQLYQLPVENDYRLDLPDFSNWVSERGINSVLIINPGNPTGELIPLADMLAFLTQMNQLKLILVDESFIDFSGVSDASLLPYVEDFKNLIVIRSMSKHCGVPGLRLGYCCTSNSVFLSKIRQALPVWNINTIAEYFLTMLKETDDIYQKSVRKIVRDVKYLYRNLVKIPGFKVYPTGSNFIMVKVECGLTAQQIQYRLLEDFGLYVRDCSNKIGIDRFHIRIASQGRKKDQLLVDALNIISEENYSR